MCLGDWLFLSILEREAKRSEEINERTTKMTAFPPSIFVDFFVRSDLDEKGKKECEI